MTIQKFLISGEETIGEWVAYAQLGSTTLHQYQLRYPYMVHVPMYYYHGASEDKFTYFIGHNPSRQIHRLQITNGDIISWSIFNPIDYISLTTKPPTKRNNLLTSAG